MREFSRFLNNYFLKLYESLGLSKLLGVHIFSGLFLLVRLITYLNKEPKDRKRSNNDLFQDIILVGLFIYLFFEY